LQPVTCVHQVALERVDSPLLRVIALLRKHAGKPAKEIKRIAERMDGGRSEQTVETFFIFTQTPEALCALLAAGTAALRARALCEVGAKVALQDVPKLGFAASAHYAAHFLTAIRY